MREVRHDIDSELTVISEPRFSVTSTCCSAATTQLGTNNNENDLILAFVVQDYAPAFALHRCTQWDGMQLVGPLLLARPIDIQLSLIRLKLNETV